MAGSVTFALFTSAPLWRIAGTFHVDAAVGTAHNTRNQRQQAFKSLVCVGSVFNGFFVIVSVTVGTFSSVAVSDTVTEVVTATGFNSKSTVLSAPLGTVISCAACKTGKAGRYGVGAGCNILKTCSARCHRSPSGGSSEPCSMTFAPGT